MKKALRMTLKIMLGLLATIILLFAAFGLLNIVLIIITWTKITM